jgi:hypothetical protein
LNNHSQTERGIKAAQTRAAIKQVLGKIVTHLPQEDDSEDREYTYKDAQTGRSFEIRQYEGMDDAGQPTSRYFMSEWTPNGRLCEQDKRGKLRFREDPRIREAEKRVGPNKLFDELSHLSIEVDKLVLDGGGLGVNSRFFPTLRACAQNIVKALKADKRYCDIRRVSRQERIQRERRQAKDSNAYWKAQKAALDTADAVNAGLFKGCHTMMGAPLSKEARERVLAYLNRPSQESWLEVRSLCITGSATLWQAWGLYDVTAPRSGNVGYPERETLISAIRHAVEEREKEIAQRLAATTPSGLRIV